MEVDYERYNRTEISTKRKRTFRDLREQKKKKKKRNFPGLEGEKKVKKCSGPQGGLRDKGLRG